MRGYLLYIIYITSFLLSSCNSSIKTEKKLTGKTVEVILKDGKYTLYRHGEPYYIKGASGTSNLELLKKIGGNSFRTYTTENANELLDKAQELGLTVMLGVWVEPYSKHNDLTDTNFTKRTLRFIEREVNRYKDHPALLMWGLGNEVHPIAPNLSSWKFLNEACIMVKKIDTNHPVSTCIAGYPRRNMSIIKTILTDVDFISFNTFGGIETFEKKLSNFFWGFNGPYIFSEWGANGYWEIGNKTKWKSAIEPPHSKLAINISEMYRKHVKRDKKQCLGGYAFYWGQKQEYTNSWYSLFSKNNEKTLVTDTLASLWGGDKLSNYSPSFKSVEWSNYKEFTNIVVKPISHHSIVFNAFDNENDSLSVTAEIRNETSVNVDDFGDEKEPLEIKDLIYEIGLNKINFKAPSNAGLYRIYIKLSDNKGSCDLINIPFKVKG